MTANTNSNSAREASLARRRALSTKGKAALGGSSAAAGRSNASASSAPAATGTPATAARPVTTPGGSARKASLARRQAMSTRGKAGISARDRVRTAPGRAAATQQSAPAPQQDKGDCGCGCKGEKKDRVETRDTQPAVSTNRPKVNPAVLSKAPKNMNPTRAASLARRQAMSTRGKAGISKNGMSAAQTARAANPNLSSRELAQELRRQRSKNGKTGQQQKSEPVGRRRTKAAQAGAASDQPWKVGVSETVRGQSVTGTMVGRSQKTTGDEPSTCRSVTGTEYMGADIFRSFCQSEPGKGPSKVRVSPTSHGNRVTGNEVGRSKRVTGDEPGTCKRVTGSEYVGANQSEAFCGTPIEPGPSKVSGSETRKGKVVTGNNVGRATKVTGDEYGSGRELTGSQYMKKADGKAPAKVGGSKTLRGGSVSGTMVGRSERVTGDEPGSCRNITGDDYVGQEQYSGFCAKTPAPKDQKVGVSQTLKGRQVSGTMTGRGSAVTGDEPGTCKAITGTPYAGAEQYRSYCEPEQAQMAEARTRPQRSTPGSVMTGIQPGIKGKRMTGAERGACEPVSGTPYVGADDFAAACPSAPAEPGSPDFPQPLGGTPWGDFSVEAPSHASQTPAAHSSVTGSSYEKGSITGPFGMASGKVTGTEEARFGRGNGQPAPAPMPETVEEVDGRVKGRITGEGMEAGLKITGDDWDRGDRVTGTEGMSAVRRNPTRRGGGHTVSAMQPPKRNEEVPEPVSKVTGGSGNTEKGSLITYSGGARG